MPLAAVPAYLGQDFKTASPGLRFGYYLPVWTSRAEQEKAVRQRAGGKSPQAREVNRHLREHGMDATIAWLKERQRNPLEGLWSKNRFAAGHAWKDICTLTVADARAMEALNARQAAMLSDLPREAVLSLSAQSTAPFTTGLGNEHPLENGFAFLWPYGLPYLPGSGVKGVLRQAARELAKGTWGDTRGWDEAAITALFGSEDSSEARRGAIAFYDVIPHIRGNALQVEVMTPHQGHYYQGTEPPHDSGQPVPIYYLTVPPGSAFTFHVVCHLPFLRRVAPALADGAQWQALLRAAFEHAFDWLGFGAKTAVGYGAMRIDEQAENARREAERRTREEEDKRRELAEATAGLPEDAARIEAWRREVDWKDNNAFFAKVESLLENTDELSAEAWARLHAEMEKRWPGIMANPDATKGKKNKARYKDRPRKLAKSLLGHGDTGDD